MIRKQSVEHTRALSVRQNFSWTLAGNLFSAACNWLVLSAIAKLGSADLLGQYALGLAIAGPAVTLAHMQLRSLVTSDAKRDYLFGEYLSLGLLTLSLAVIVVAAIAFGGRENAAGAMVIATVGLSESLFSFSEITYGLFQREERLDRITISLVLRGVFSLLAVVGGLYLTNNILWAVAGLATTHAIVLLGYDLPTASAMLRHVGTNETTRLHWDARRLFALFWLAIPIGVTLVLNMVNYNVSRYFIAAYLSNRDLGIFAASASFIGAGQRILSAFSYSVSSRLARYFSERLFPQFTSLILKLSAMGFGLGLVFILGGAIAGKWILTVVFSSEFAEHDDVLLWLLAAGAVGYISVWGPALDLRPVLSHPDPYFDPRHRFIRRAELAPDSFPGSGRRSAGDIPGRGNLLLCRYVGPVVGASSREDPLSNRGKPPMSESPRLETVLDATEGTLKPRVLWSFAIFVFSIPFETLFKQEQSFFSLSKMTGVVMMVMCLSQARECFRRFPAALWMFVLYLWAYVIVGIFQRADFQGEMFGRIITLSQMFVLFWIAYNIFADERGALFFLHALALSCMFVAVLQLTGLTATTTQLGEAQRVSVLNEDPNTVGSVLALGILCLIGMYYSPPKTGLVGGLLLLMPVCLTVLTLANTGSRGGMLALAVGLIILGLGQGAAWIRLRNIGVLTLVGAVMIMVVLSSPAASQRWQMTLHEGSTAGRTEIYAEAIKMVIERPIFGWGPVHHYYELGTRMHVWPVRDTHNLFLWLLTEVGVFGALPYFIGLGMCAFAALRGRNSFHSILPITLFVTIIIINMSLSWQNRKLHWLVLAYAFASSLHVIAPAAARNADRIAHIRNVLSRRRSPKAAPGTSGLRS